MSGMYPPLLSVRERPRSWSLVHQQVGWILGTSWTGSWWEG